ncbi:hypothetical protein GCM10023083_45020 [Streptomyces phyllanthi]
MKSTSERTESPLPERPVRWTRCWVRAYRTSRTALGCRCCGIGSTCSIGPREPISNRTGTRYAGRVAAFPRDVAAAAMWGGGHVRTRGPLTCGEPAAKRSRIRLSPFLQTWEGAASGRLANSAVGPGR